MTDAQSSPERGLGWTFTTMWTAAVASNAADGLGRTAIPLIATTLTRDPLLISGITAIAFVPWFVFGLPAGVLVDRMDRRIAMSVANGIRVGMALAIAASIMTDALSIWLLYACVLVWGLGETVYDTASHAMVPSIVRKGDLERANGRMLAAQQVVDGFIATPIAGVLFAAAIALPVWSTAAGYLVGAALILLLPLSVGRAFVTEPASVPERRSAAADMREPVSYLWNHLFLRRMVMLTSAVGFIGAFAQASVVLLFLQDFDVPPALYGFVTAGISVGALAGTLLASRLVARFGRGPILLVGSLLDAVGLLGVGFSPNAGVAVIFYAVGAAGIGLWNVPWGALRQDIIPGRLLGRSIGLIRAVTWGMLPVGALLGGLIARAGLALPFVIGGSVCLVVTLVASRFLLSASRHSGADAP